MEIIKGLTRKYAPAKRTRLKKTKNIPIPVLDRARSFKELIRSEAFPTSPDIPSEIPFSASFVV